MLDELISLEPLLFATSINALEILVAGSKIPDSLKDPNKEHDDSPRYKRNDAGNRDSECDETLFLVAELEAMNT